MTGPCRRALHAPGGEATPCPRSHGVSPAPGAAATSTAARTAAPAAATAARTAHAARTARAARTACTAARTAAAGLLPGRGWDGLRRGRRRR